MELNNKALDFWEDTTTSINYYVEQLIKDHLKNKGWSENDYIFYIIENKGVFPIKIKYNMSCSCHPEYEVVFEVYKKDILKKIVEEKW